MTRRPLSALAALMLSAVALPAQTVPELAEVPPQIQADAASQGQVDRMRAWPVLWNDDRLMDLWVQVAYATGGNAVSLVQYVYTGTPDGYVRAAQSTDMRGVKRITQTDAGLDVTFYTMRPGDPRCCPSGEETLRITPGQP